VTEGDKFNTSWIRMSAFGEGRIGPVCPTWAQSGRTLEPSLATAALEQRLRKPDGSPPHAYGRASRTMLNGPCVARRTFEKPALRTMSVSTFSPTWAPKAAPTS
jgi:hypothetical protein